MKAVFVPLAAVDLVEYDLVLAAVRVEAVEFSDRQEFGGAQSLDVGKHGAESVSFGQLLDDALLVVGDVGARERCLFAVTDERAAPVEGVVPDAWNYFECEAVLVELPGADLGCAVVQVGLGLVNGYLSELAATVGGFCPSSGDG